MPSVLQLIGQLPAPSWRRSWPATRDLFILETVTTTGSCPVAGKHASQRRGGGCENQATRQPGEGGECHGEEVCQTNEAQVLHVQKSRDIYHGKALWQGETSSLFKLKEQPGDRKIIKGSWNFWKGRGWWVVGGGWGRGRNRGRVGYRTFVVLTGFWMPFCLTWGWFSARVTAHRRRKWPWMEVCLAWRATVSLTRVPVKSGEVPANQLGDPHPQPSPISPPISACCERSRDTWIWWIKFAGRRADADESEPFVLRLYPRPLPRFLPSLVLERAGRNYSVSVARTGRERGLWAHQVAEQMLAGRTSCSPWRRLPTTEPAAFKKSHLPSELLGPARKALFLISGGCSSVLDFLFRASPTGLELSSVSRATSTLHLSQARGWQWPTCEIWRNSAIIYFHGDFIGHWAWLGLETLQFW